MTLLAAHDLRKTFRRGRGVTQVSVELAAGEVVGLLGANGAGKTTTFRLLTGDLQPDAGRVLLAGRDVSEWSLRRRVRDGGMGYLPQEPSVFGSLSVEDNLLTILHAHGLDAATRRRRCDEMLERFEIAPHRHTLAQFLSGGQKRRLEFARCLIGNPRVVLLDEPFIGIDPITVEYIQQVVRDLCAAGISFIITDHHVVETLAIADRAYVIHEGCVLFHGTPAALAADPAVRRHYLGEGLRLPAAWRSDVRLAA